MKKYVVLGIILEVLITGASIVCYFYFYNNDTTQPLVNFLQIIIQSTITGLITFGGLFFTIWSQEHQTKMKEDKNICPCIIAKKIENITAQRKVTSIKETSETIICTTDEDIRIVKCTFCNCKNTYGLNLFINSKNGNILLSNIKDNDFTLSLAISCTDGYIYFYYEDIYGQKYRQKLTYKYSGSLSEQLRFISYQPERIRKNVSKYK